MDQTNFSFVLGVMSRAWIDPAQGRGNHLLVGATEKQTTVKTFCKLDLFRKGEIMDYLEQKVRLTQVTLYFLARRDWDQAFLSVL